MRTINVSMDMIGNTKEKREKKRRKINWKCYYEDLTPSHVQAKRIRELGEKGELDSDVLESIFWNKNQIKLKCYLLMKREYEKYYLKILRIIRLKIL